MKYEEAFNKALTLSDVSVVTWLIKQVRLHCRDHGFSPELQASRECIKYHLDTSGQSRNKACVWLFLICPNVSN